MATLAVQRSSVVGVDLTETAANGAGDDFPNNEATVLVINNGDASPVTVTFDDTASAAPAGATSFDADVAVVVAAGAIAVVGPFPISRFTGSVVMTYSGVTSLTVSPVNTR